MTTDHRQPEAALPDELLLDLVEGTLRSEDVERVRAALKSDPRLARRLEAMRADRKVLASMGDRDASPAPAGLVADAMGSVERDHLLGATTRAPKRGRRLAPLLVAASLGVVAVAGWYAYDAGYLTGVDVDTPENSNATVVLGPERDPYDPKPIDSDRVVRTQEQYEEQFRHESLANDARDHVTPGTNPFDDPQPMDLVGVGAPLTADAVPLPVENTPAMTDLTDVIAEAQDEQANTVAARPIAPEAVIPDDAVAWARAGLLGVSVAPLDGADGKAFDDFQSRVAQRLRIAYDPSLSTGWGITSAPAPTNAEIASITGPNPIDNAPWEDVATSERPLVASFRVELGADDDTMLAAIRTMASGVRTLTGQRVELTRLDTVPENAPPPGSTALTVDNLLWWRLPVERWTPLSVYHVPVRTTPAGG